MAESELDDLVAKAAKLSHQFSLDGKKALVIGGNKGLGQAMSLGLGAAGADVCIVGRGPDGLEDTAKAVGKLGRKGIFLPVDVTNEEKIEGMVSEVMKAFGRIDILVNSQGMEHLQPAADFDLEIWQRVMDVNLRSVVAACQQVGRVMLSQGYGKIINISSVRSFQGRVGDLAYAASKGAINQLTRSLALEWGVKGINVNALAPTFTRTALSRPVLDDPIKREWVFSRSPMGRIGELHDMFGPVVFLASDASAFVNGHVLMVDGGWTVA